MTPLAWRLKARRPEGEAGFSMIEMVIALLIIAIVTTGSLTFFINNLRSVNGQGQRQQAVNLANQQLETVQSVPVDKLVKGRTSAAVAAILASPVATKLRLSTQDDTASSADYDPTATGASTQVIPTTSTQTVNGVPYQIYTFIDACYFDVSSGVCGPTTATNKTQEYRVSVNVRWQSNGQCTTSCDYSTSTLIDPTANPQFNSNISTPSGSYFSVGANTTPGLNPSVVADSQITDSCTINGNTYAGTKVVLNGVGLKSSIRVWISSGGGVIPPASIYQPIATEVDFCLQTSEAPGAYTLSVINTDGGHFQLPITEIPSITDAGSWDPVNKKLTLTGTGFETGAVFTVTGTGSPSFSTATGQGTTFPTTIMGTNDTVKLTNYVGTKDGNVATVTVTNPDASTASFTITAPKITAVTAPIAAGATTKSESITGSGFSASSTTAVGVSNGTVGTLNVTSGTTATLPAVPTATGSPQLFYLYNDDGGFTSNASITVDPQPTVTSVTPNSVVAGTSTTVTVNGTSFPATGMTASTSNGTVVSAVTYVSATQIKVTLTAATTNTDTITLLNTNDGGSVTFSVGVTPAFTSASPASVKAGVPTVIAVVGAGFVGPMTVSTSNGTASAAIVDSTHVNVTVTPSATKTDTLTLRNADGSSVVFAVGVTPNAVSLSPNSVPVGSATTVTVTGFGFAGPMTASTTNGSVGAVTVIDANHVSLSLTPTATKTDVVTLTNADGSSTTFTAGVVPGVTSFTPNPPTHNATPTWTITGAGFVSGATVTVSGAGFITTANTFNVVSSTQMTFKAKVVNDGSGNTVYPFTVTVTNPDGSVSAPKTQPMKPS